MLAHAVFILAGIFVFAHGKHILIETEDKDDVESQDTSNDNDYQDIPAEGIVKTNINKPHVYFFFCIFLYFALLYLIFRINLFLLFLEFNLVYYVSFCIK